MDRIFVASGAAVDCGVRGVLCWMEVWASKGESSPVWPTIKVVPVTAEEFE